jgi:hypothetical protein
MSKAAELAALIGSQSSLANRNLLINGDMSVAQRGTSLSIVHDGTSDGYACDRWLLQEGNHDQTEGTLAQVAVTDLAGFNNALKWTTTEPESAIAADETFDICQKIEAQHCQRLGYGLSSAKSATLSFYVKSSVTGTYGINVYKPDTTTRQLTSTYTINSADTWEKKTITIPGDTDSGGTIADDNGSGLRITWHLGTGSNFTSANTALTWTNYADAGWAYGHAQNGVLTTDNATWFLTGVQFEIGEVATPFQHESYGDNLIRCRRYFQQYDATNAYTRFALGVAYDGSSIAAPLNLPVQMRAAPTFGSSGNFDTLPDTIDLDTMSVQHATNEMVEFRAVDSGNGLTTNRPYVIRADNDTSTKIQFISEL